MRFIELLFSFVFSQIVSKTERAGLIMSVARIERNLRHGNYAKRNSSTSAVYLSGVLEYLVAEVLELAGYAAVDNKKQRITPRHIMLAVKHDSELSELLNNVSFSEAGVLIPHLNSILLQTTTIRTKTGSRNVFDESFADKSNESADKWNETAVESKESEDESNETADESKESEDE